MQAGSIIGRAIRSSEQVNNLELRETQSPVPGKEMMLYTVVEPSNEELRTLSLGDLGHMTSITVPWFSQLWNGDNYLPYKAIMRIIKLKHTNIKDSPGDKVLFRYILL